MKVVAVCCSLARADLGEFLGSWAVQTLQLPLFLALDVPASRWLPEVPVQIGDDANAEHGPAEWVAQRAPERVRRGAYPRSIGPLRAWAVECACALWGLDLEDAVLVLDDDDYYAPNHARATVAALSASGGRLVGARNFGIVWKRVHGEPELVRGGPYGPGPHATWGMPLRAYTAAGGYQPDAEEDLALLSRIGWQQCLTHTEITHVRRQFGAASYSATQGDRARLEASGEVDVVPRLTSAMEALAEWCALQRP